MHKDPDQPNESHASPNASYAAMGGLGSLDQVRDILFGSHVREINERFRHLEERLEREVADLKVSLQGQFETLEGIIKEGWARTDTRFQEEAEQRTALAADLHEKHENMRRMMDRARAELEAQIAVTDEMFRELLSEQSQALMDRLRAQEQALHANLQHLDERLEEKKVDRISLAGLFQQVATQLLDAEQAERSPLFRPDWGNDIEKGLAESDGIQAERVVSSDSEPEPSSEPQPMLAVPMTEASSSDEEAASESEAIDGTEEPPIENNNAPEDEVIITIPEPKDTEAAEPAPSNPPPLPMTFDVDVALAEAMDTEEHTDETETEETDTDTLPADRN